MWPLLTETKPFWPCCRRSRNRHWQLPALRTLKRGCSKIGDSLRIFWPAWHSFIKTCWHLVNHFVTVGKSLSRAANAVLKLFDVLFLQEQLVASFALLEKNLDSQFFCSFVFFSKVVCGWYWWSSDYVEKRQWCGVGPPVDVRMFAINRRNVRPKLEMDFIGKLSQWWTSTLRKGKLSFSIRIGGYAIISIHFRT